MSDSEVLNLKLNESQKEALKPRVQAKLTEFGEESDDDILQYIFVLIK